MKENKTQKKRSLENEELRPQVKETIEIPPTIFDPQNKSSEMIERFILDQATDVIIICDENGKIIKASEVTHRYFGPAFLLQPFDAILNLHFSSPHTLQKEDFSLSDVLRGQVFRRVKVTLEREGKVSYFLLSARPLTERYGRIRGCMVTLTEITERKRVEEELRQAHLLLEAVTKGTGVIIAAQDTSFHYTFFNKAYEEEINRLTGKSIAIGTSMAEVFAHMPEQQKVALEEWSQALRGETTNKTIEFGDPSHYRRFYSVLHTPIRDAEGNMVGAGEVAYDITGQMQAQEVMKQSELKFRILADNTYDMEFWINPEGHFIFVSPSCERITGHDPNEFIQNPKLMRHLVHPDDLPIFDRHLQKEMTSQELQFRIIHSNGSIRWMGHVCQRIFDAQGHYLGIRGSNRDITERKWMEEELRKSCDELESRVQERTIEVKRQLKILDAFFSSTVTPLVFLDRHFNFVRVNEAYAKACQREASEFPGHNHFEFYPSDAKKIFEQVVNTKKPYQAVARSFTFPDHPEWGTTYWDWILTPILDGKDEVEFLVFSLQDVTSRVQMEKERTRLAHIVEITSDLIGMANLNGQIFYLNKAGRKMLGFSEEKDISEVRISDTHPNFANAMVLNEGIPTALQTGFWSGETTFLSHDGREIPASQVILAHKGPNGEVEFLSTIARDITDRKWAEQAVEAERRRFYDVLEMLPAYLVLLSPDYHVLFANRFFRERFGESHGKPCFEYLFGRSDPCEVCETYTVLKTKTPHEWEWIGPDGRIYQVFDFPFTDVDGSTLILEMGIDFTERKQAEEALRESENRLRTLSTQLLMVQENERKRISREIHDSIGQSLSAIKFKVESITQQMRESVHKKIAESLETLLPIIQTSIEDSRRIQMDLRPSVLDDLGILPTLEWFCREYQKIYSHIRIEKKTDIKESDIPISIKTEIYRVTQEAFNNIAKHSKADLVRLSFGKKEDKIELIIQDNGIGFILEEILSQKRSKKGLGLTSMRERMELSGGSFIIGSVLGKGTTIRAEWLI
jgi:PAS domain S-box-containing protein